jgi:CBS-domain-containing membrane protein
MELLARWDGEESSRVPFVTSIVLVTSLPDSEAARPYIGGHFLSSIAGLIAFWMLGSTELATATGVSLATFLMLTTRTLHPPAGIDAFLIPAYALPAAWVFNPMLAGAILLAAFGAIWSFAEKALLRRLDNGKARRSPRIRNSDEFTEPRRQR